VVQRNRDFQAIFDMARYYALRCWMIVANKTGRLPRVPTRGHSLPVRGPGLAPEPAQWSETLSCYLEGTFKMFPHEPLPCRSRLRIPVDRAQDITPASILPDLRDLADGWLGGDDIAGSFPSYIYQLERVQTFFAGEAIAARDTPGAGSPPVLKRPFPFFWRKPEICMHWSGELAMRQAFLRLALSYFLRVLDDVDEAHLWGSFMIIYCKAVLSTDDHYRLSRRCARCWFAANLKGKGEVILAAAESLRRPVEEEGPAPLGNEVGAIAGAGDQAGQAEAPEGRAEQEGARPAPATPPGVDEGVGASGRGEPAEASEVRVEDVGGQPAPSLPPAAEADAITGAREGAAEAPEPADLAAARDDSTTAGPVPRTSETTQAAQAAAGGGGGSVTAPAGAPEGRPAEAPAHERSTARRRSPWAPAGTKPPAGYHDKPLGGKIWEITSALHLARFLRTVTGKTLTEKLRKGKQRQGKQGKKTAPYWGRKSGSEYDVFVRDDYPPEKLQTALDKLEEIKERGNYHPEWYELPDGYEKYQDRALEAGTKEVLAQVLREVGLLRKATADCLDKAVKTKRSRLFGRYGGAHFTIHLHKDCADEQVDRACALLRSRSDSARAAADPDGGDPPQTGNDRL
jgi:hypothetical protein